jgi:hypothetical protein
VAKVEHVIAQAKQMAPRAKAHHEVHPLAREKNVAILKGGKQYEGENQRQSRTSVEGLLVISDWISKKVKITVKAGPLLARSSTQNKRCLAPKGITKFIDSHVRRTPRHGKEVSCMKVKTTVKAGPRAWST